MFAKHIILQIHRNYNSKMKILLYGGKIDEKI